MQRASATADLNIFPGAEVWAEEAPGLYRRGLVLEASGEELLIDFSDGEEELCSRNLVWPANEPGLYAEDLASLVHLSSATLIENLRQGLMARKIYSWVGPILLALNPMQPLSSLYAENVMLQCREASRAERLAHPFMQAELALRELLSSRRSSSLSAQQSSAASFVVSGESGAGKTETTRQLLNYCLWRAGHPHVEPTAPRGNGGSGGGGLAATLLEASSVVELFGSAATLHNPNSSRVGRFLELDLHLVQRSSSAASSSSSTTTPGLAVMGARLQTFLLERSRVVSVGQGERGFHIFYGLLSSHLAVLNGLAAHGATPADFGYLRLGVGTLAGRADDDDFDRLQDALRVLGLSDSSLGALGCLLASVLLLGNLSFEQNDDGHAAPVAEASPLLEQLRTWLGCDLSPALVSRQLQAGGIRLGAAITTHLDAAAAVRARDAVARSLYANLFAHVVTLVNGALEAPPAASANTADAMADIRSGGGPGGAAEELAGHARSGTLGLLDIFGFERFETNSLEQLLINYANERLHGHFLSCVFEAERATYESEGVPFPDVTPPSNADLLALISEPPRGILPLLDDQSSLQSPSDDALPRRCCRRTRSPRAPSTGGGEGRRGRRGSVGEGGEGGASTSEFVLRHYAGSLRYNAQGFVEKNTDKLLADASALLADSKFPEFRLFGGGGVGGRGGGGGGGGAGGGRGGGGGGGGARRAANTVSAAFGESLRDLGRTLAASKSYFIRCVRPRGGVHAVDAKRSRAMHREQTAKRLKLGGGEAARGDGGGGAAFESSAALLDAINSEALHGPVVLAQLEASGVLEAISLMSLGFPSRIPYNDIAHRYERHPEP